jgi:hypothetical protein
MQAESITQHILYPEGIFRLREWNIKGTGFLCLSVLLCRFLCNAILADKFAEKILNFLRK